MPSQPFPFAGLDGKLLAGRLERPEGPAHGCALLAHCFTCSKDSLAAVRVARALAAQGIAVLRFDFTGLGDSEGSFGEEGFSRDVLDVVAAARALTAAGMPPGLLVGHSLGGAAVLAAASELPEVTAVATIAAPFDVAHVKGHFGESLQRILDEGEAEVRLAGRSFTVRRSFVEDLSTHDQGARIAALKRPLLILHSPRDEVVGIDNATAIYTAARHPKSFISLDGANHLLTEPADAEFAARTIAAWAGRYLPRTAAPQRPEEERRVTAELTGDGRFQTRIGLRGGAIFADEPIEAGGTDTGPTPYELLSAALAACTAMTLRLYADAKNWELPGFRVKVAHARVPESPRDIFTREISFEPPVDAERRARLIAIADKCPVHRTLEGASRVVTVDGGDSPPAEPPGQHRADMDRVGSEAGEATA